MKYDFDDLLKKKEYASGPSVTRPSFGMANSTASTVEKKPFAATAPGLALNTLKAIPDSTVDVGKNILRGSARVIGSAGVTLAKPLGGAEQLGSDSFSSNYGQALYETVFGFEPVKSLEDRIVDTDFKIKSNPAAQKLGLDKMSLPLAFGGIIGEAALELTGLGASKNIGKQLVKETTEAGVLKILRGADEEVAKTFAPHFAKAKTQEEVDTIFKFFQSAIGTKALETRGSGESIRAVKNIAEEDLFEMRDFTDYVNGAYKPKNTVQLEIDARRIAERYGVNPNQSNTNLSNRFGKILDEKFNKLPLGDRSIRGDGGRFAGSVANKAPTEAFGAVGGIEVDEDGKVNFDPTKAALGVVGVAGFTKGRQFLREGKLLADEAKKFKSADEFVDHFARNPEKIPVSQEYKKYLAEQEELIKKENSLYDRRRELRDRYADKTIDQVPKKDIDEYESLDAELNKTLSKKTLTKSPEVPIKTNIGEKALREQLTDFYKETVEEGGVEAFRTKAESQLGRPVALTSREKRLIEEGPIFRASGRPLEVSPGEARSIEIQAEEARNIAKGGDVPEGVSFNKVISDTVTPVEKKVNIIDTYLRTPNRVMKKIGFETEAKELRGAADEYWKELPKNIDKIKEWASQVPAESNKRIFKWLDGQAIDLRPEELKVANEVKTWLQGWAERLKIQPDNRISNYITHIFEKGSQKEFDEELAKLIADKIPGSVYDPFTLKRLGARGYKEDTWAALDAYVKRGTRKVHFDPVLDRIQSKAGSALDVSNIEKSQWKYINNYINNINMRPTDLDESIDNVIKSTFGNRFGQRPVTSTTALLRRMTYRGMLGLNPGSALRNISQGINTYATLGEKYTTIGYASLFKRGAMDELTREGVLNAGFIQDKTLSATGKAMEKIDKGLFFFFDQAEKLNRGSAYFGAKSKALQSGKTEEEAIKYAKEIVRKTQFVFDTVDTPVGMGSDIVKTLAQFQTYTTKQLEFLAEMAKDKNFVGLLRYGVAGMIFVYTIGKAFGMEPKELLPIYRVGTPPSLKLPVEATKAVVDAPDKYGNQRTLGKKIKDVGNASIGLIPGGTQIKKTLGGAEAVSEGAVKDKAGRTQFEAGGSTWADIQAYLFGKYASPEAKAYFDKKEVGVSKKKEAPKKKKTYSF